VALKREIYNALEDVLGRENVSEDPVILDSYAWRSGLLAGTDKFVPRFEAVTLPNNTEEVQAIVKLCNRYKLQFKASSTGWAYCDPSGPGVIKIDLRRMNRIIEINEKNMYAVVEPYVVATQLQAELMKRGLNCSINGAGGNCSALPIAGHAGLGPVSESGSYGERNQLALEWVTPEGEIVRLGSLGSLGEWFCGDGPGPSLRGIVRGNTVPLGGLGVYTKAAQKIYHWAGPPIFPIEGVSPHYATSQMPSGFMFANFYVPSAEKMIEAVRKIGESEIGFQLMISNIAKIAVDLSKINIEDLDQFDKMSLLAEGPSFMLVIVGNSPRDFEYKKRALQQIMEETGAKTPEPAEDPRFARGFIWSFIRCTEAAGGCFRTTGAFGGMVPGTDILSLMINYIQTSAKTMEDFIKKERLLAVGTVSFVQTIENGHHAHAELLTRYFPNNPELAEGGRDFNMEANRTAIKGHFGVPHHVWSDAVHDMYGPHTSNYTKWLRKIKKTFDPNEASESSNYISAKAT
jgi:glycolate oxidase